ncbi:MAG: PH domain-containing protein [Planctomycetota bacterium]
MSNTPRPLLYRCPVCDVDIAAPPRMIGEVVRCPIETCNQPIMVEAPRAEFIGVAPEGADQAAVARTSPIDQERTLLSLHPSWWRNSPIKFSSGVFGAVAAAIGVIWGLVAWNAILGWLSVAAFLFIGVSMAIWYIDMIATTLVITTRRTTLRKGIFEKNTNEVQHDDVRNIQVEQNVFDRMLGVGTLKISSSGQDDLEIVVPGILHPAKVADTIRSSQ